MYLLFQAHGPTNMEKYGGSKYQMLKFHSTKSSSKNALMSHPLWFSMSLRGQLMKEGRKLDEEKERESNLITNVSISQDA